MCCALGRAWGGSNPETPSTWEAREGFLEEEKSSGLQSDRVNAIVEDCGGPDAIKERAFKGTKALRLEATWEALNKITGSPGEQAHLDLWENKHAGAKRLFLQITLVCKLSRVFWHHFTKG